VEVLYEYSLSYCLYIDNLFKQKYVTIWCENDEKNFQRATRMRVDFFMLVLKVRYVQRISLIFAKHVMIVTTKSFVLYAFVYS
jgi:hypothetical protein